MVRIPQRYIPKNISKKDKSLLRKQLKKSRKLYKKNKYHTRAKVKSFKSKKSGHVANAKKMYNVNKISASNKLAKKTKCTKATLDKIVNKGRGAYFSSGSRPNQTPSSWGFARLASAITGGKASAVDFKLLTNGCKKNSRAVNLAKKAMKKYKKGTRKVKKVKL
jgi:hypothetical protein